MPDLVSTWGSQEVSVWTRGYGGWDGYWPPEDSALAPRLAWDEQQRVLITRAVAMQPDDPAFTTDVSWPPRGRLWQAGYAFPPNEVDCAEHGIAYERDCPNCLAAEAETAASDDRVEPAEWHWHVLVEWEERDDDDLVDSGAEWTQVMTTYMDPRDVEYGR